MLRTQRLLAFVGRIQNYCLLLLCFFLLAYLACGFFVVPEDLIRLLVICADVVCWTIYFLSVWIFSLSLVVWGTTRVFPTRFFILMLVRTAVAFGLTLLRDLIEHMVQEGILISW